MCSRAAAPAALTFILIAILFLPVAPADSACASISTPAFSHLQWVHEDAVVTRSGQEVGVYSLENSNFDSAVFGAAPRAYVASPDGKWLAYAREASTSGPCASPHGGVGAINLETGETVTIREGSTVALAGGPDALTVVPADAGHVLFYPWGAWDASRETALDAATSEGDGLNASRVVGAALGPDGELAVVERYGPHDRLRVWLLHAANGMPLDPENPVPSLAEGRLGELRGLAFSPDGTHLAVATQRPLHGGSVDVVTAQPGDVHGVWSHGYSGTLGGLSWGPLGLAEAYTRHPPESAPAGAPPVGEVFLYPHAPESNVPRVEEFFGFEFHDAAWSPDGARLAVGGNGALHLLDADLDLIRIQTIWGETFPGEEVRGGNLAALLTMPAPGALAAVLAVGAVGTGLRFRTRWGED